MALRKHLQMEKSNCYLCCNNSTKQKSQDKDTGNAACSSAASSSSTCKAEMEVDVENLNAALHELGMLSAITESRKQYLKEITSGSSHNKSLYDVGSGTGVQFGRTKGHERKDVTTAGFCVLHMNSDYIRDFRASWDCDQESLELRGPAGRAPSTFKRDIPCCREDRAVSRPRLYRCGLHFLKPYSVPCDAKQRRRGWSWWSRNQDSESSSKSSRDSGLGNRSNPGSPEKGGGTPELLPNGLVRSRSLDDIEAINQAPFPEPDLSSGVTVPVYNYTTSQRNEIESVSQRMEHLHVN